ncbi:hypothetical protein ACFWMG_38920 [Streptomyces sp. NPDC127074]|uniref:hypothetical protein n=1 Tax=Streptomyces sp. NPDC127074 TaxID=3347130 RepID=UPI003649229F
MSEVLVAIADRDWSRRGGRSAEAAELAVHIADVRQRERAGPVRPSGGVRPGLEALGEGGGLCTARTVKLSTGDVILCTLEAGHYDPDNMPSWKDGKPGGWRFCNASIWDGSAAYSHPYVAV